MRVAAVAHAARPWFVVGVAAWTAFAVLIQLWVDLAAVYDGRQPDLVANLVGSLGQMYALGLLTPALVFVVRRFPPTGRPVAATVGVYVASLLGVSVVGLPLLAFVSNEFLGRHFTLKTTLQEGIFACLVYAVVLTIIVAVTQVQVANERLARALRLEADLSRVRVEALQRQLHPHFIFNTLNAVGAIMHTDVDAAEEMLAALADLLRTATDRSNSPMVPLREELSLLDRYALIMKMRYGDRLVVKIVTEPGALEVPFPTFTLQPLVENAIVHGLEKTDAGITVELACRLESGKLVIDVEDNGAATDATILQEGIGIGNTRARLAELYGQRATLSIAPRRSNGMHFTLTIPSAPAI